LSKGVKPAHVAGNASDAQQRLAVLIDADNAPAAIVEGLFAEIAKYGVASVKRIYGDWTQPLLGGWKKVLLDHSITPIQQFAYTTGKNATDSALIIDAMDLLYTRRFGGFCLVSSDSDFTRLAARIREEGLTVYGFGERKTPEPFVSACDKFIYTEVLRAPSAQPPAAEPRAVPGKDERTSLIGLIASAIDDVSEDDGWANLGAVGSTITKLRPSFDPRLHGQKKLSDLVRSLREFSVEERGGPDGTAKSIYVRNR
jgi:NYN domain/OST-HTH/LOTUS domain